MSSRTHWILIMPTEQLLIRRVANGDRPEHYATQRESKRKRDEEAAQSLASNVKASDVPLLALLMLRLDADDQAICVSTRLDAMSDLLAQSE